MLVTRKLNWPANFDATVYDLSEVNPDGSLTLVSGGLAVPYTTVAVDDTAMHLWSIQPRDGSGNNVAEPIEVQFEPRTTLATIRGMVRTTLNDIDSNQYRWPDVELNQYVQEAIRDYTKFYPSTTACFIPTRDQVRTYDVPDNFLNAIRVDFTDVHGIIAYLKYKPWKGGDSNITTSGYFFPYWKLGIYTVSPGRRRVQVGHFDIRDGQIEVDFNPKGTGDESLTIHYMARWTVPYSDLVRLDFPSEDLELITLYASGKANLRVEESEANLSRWLEGKRRRDDNPLEIMSTRYFHAYQKKIEDKQKKVSFLRRVRV